MAKMPDDRRFPVEEMSPDTTYMVDPDINRTTMRGAINRCVRVQTVAPNARTGKRTAEQGQGNACKQACPERGKRTLHSRAQLDVNVPKSRNTRRSEARKTRASRDTRREEARTPRARARSLTSTCQNGQTHHAARSGKLRASKDARSEARATRASRDTVPRSSSKDRCRHLLWVCNMHP